MPWCTPAEFPCESSWTLLAQRRSIQWWVFVRGAHWGQGERERSFAEKSPTFVDFRQADTENFGQGFHSVHRRKCVWGWDPRTLDLRLGPIATLEGCTVGWKSMPDFQFLRKRGKSLSKFDSVTFECLLNLKAPFYLILHTLIHWGFGVLGLMLSLSLLGTSIEWSWVLRIKLFWHEMVSLRNSFRHFFF